MTLSKPLLSSTLALLGLLALAGYGLAQQGKPAAPAQKPAAAAPAETAPKASCCADEDCPCAKAGGCAACMHGEGHPHGMHGRKPGMHGKGCPLMPIAGKADAKVENTKTGAVLRVDTTDPQQVGEIQRAVAAIAARISKK